MKESLGSRPDRSTRVPHNTPDCLIGSIIQSTTTCTQAHIGVFDGRAASLIGSETTG